MNTTTRNHGAATLAAAAALAVAALAGCSTMGDGSTADGHPSFAEAKAIAEEGFVYGLPLVMNYGVYYEFFLDKTSKQFKAPFNQLRNEHRVFTYEDTTVITPNSDTPYSAIGMDLRAEPLVFTIPPIRDKRYWSVEMLDASTFIFGYLGSRTTGWDGGNYLVAGPDWQGEVPKGIDKVFRAGSQFAMGLFRTQLLRPDDMKNVEKVQAGYKVRPLSAFLGQPAPPAPARVDVRKIDPELAKTEFFDYLDLVLQFAPPGPEEKEIREKLARIGVGPGKRFALKDLSLEHKAEILLGMKAGLAKVTAKEKEIGTSVNGWHVGSAFGDRAFYNGDWLLRAAAARLGIYGNAAEEAMYPFARTDGEGRPLDTGAHNYTLTFAAGSLPPVNAFWSVTMYDGKTQFLVKNPINRYLVNSPMLPGLKKNADGSLTIYIQKDSPGAGKESNWLPAPDGPAYIAMRLYWPRTEQPSILPPGKGQWQPPAIVRVD